MCNKHTLASCTTTSLFYVNLFKERLIVAPDFPKADAKVRTFSEPANLLWIFFGKKDKKVKVVNINQSQRVITPYYIIYKTKN